MRSFIGKHVHNSFGTLMMFPQIVNQTAFVVC